jgi:hypothetical protein
MEKEYSTLVGLSFDAFCRNLAEKQSLDIPRDDKMRETMDHFAVICHFGALQTT